MKVHVGRWSLLKLLSCSVLIATGAIAQSSGQGTPQQTSSPRLRFDRSLEDNADRLTVVGNVLLEFDGNTLRADKVVYERTGQKLTAEGRVMLLDRQGNDTRADKIQFTSEIASAFERALAAHKP